MLRGCRRIAALPITEMRIGSSLVSRSTTRSDIAATGRSYSGDPVSLSNTDTAITVTWLSDFDVQTNNASTATAATTRPASRRTRERGLGTWGLGLVGSAVSLARGAMNL